MSGTLRGIGTGVLARRQGRRVQVADRPRPVVDTHVREPRHSLKYRRRGQYRGLRLRERPRVRRVMDPRVSRPCVSACRYPARTVGDGDQVNGGVIRA
jgi:hypothetical protein